MSDYKSIAGFKVPSVSTNPSDVQEGQVWFNNSSNGIKFRVYSPGASSVTAAPNIICSGVQGNFGVSENSVMAASPDHTVKFNGTSWSRAGNGAGFALCEPYSTNTGGGLGSSNDALIFGSSYSFPCGPNGWQTGYGDLYNTAKYNGSSWSASPNFPNTERSGRFSFGSVNSAVIGGNASTTVTRFNGTSFSAGPSRNYSTSYYGFAAGNPNSGIVVQGGNVSPANTAEWNGTSWSTGSAIPKGLLQGAAIGSSKNDITAGGGATYNSGTSGPISPNTCFYKYDGTNWSTASGIPGNPQYNFNSTGQGTGSSGMMWSYSGLTTYKVVQSPAGLCTKDAILS